MESFSESYAKAGVDVTAGYESVELIKSHVKRTEIPGVMGSIGGFGGMFAVEEAAVSVQMGHDKVMRHIATGAEYIVGADSSCLKHQNGIIARDKLPIKTLHIVEILAAGL